MSAGQGFVASSMGMLARPVQSRARSSHVPPFFGEELQNGIAKAAIGSLEDGHSERCASHNARWKENFALALSALSIEVLQGGGNFVVMKFATADAAEMIFDRLLMGGIRTRRLTDCGLPSYLRLTIGTSDENEAGLHALRVIMTN